MEGDLEGEDLVITDLHVAALAHPYRGCPAIVPRCQELTGRSLVSGLALQIRAGRPWGGTAGCTHVTTLLLGLAEVRTSAFFLRMNGPVPISPSTQGRRTLDRGPPVELAPSIVGACHVVERSGPVVRARAARRLADGT